MVDYFSDLWADSMVSAGITYDPREAAGQGCHLTSSSPPEVLLSQAFHVTATGQLGFPYTMAAGIQDSKCGAAGPLKAQCLFSCAPLVRTITGPAWIRELGGGCNFCYWEWSVFTENWGQADSLIFRQRARVVHPEAGSAKGISAPASAGREGSDSL